MSISPNRKDFSLIIKLYVVKVLLNQRSAPEPTQIILKVFPPELALRV